MEPSHAARLSALAVASFVVGVLTTPAHAQTPLQLQRASRNTFRVDGSLRDWSSVAMQRFGDGDDASFEVALAQDEAGLYLAARVRDERLIRTRRPGNREDALVLTLATPGESGFDEVELWLYAGEEGRSAATVSITSPGGRARPARGARVLESAMPGGYELEAFIPFALLPNPGRVSALRAAVRLIDVDQAANPVIETTLSTAPGEDGSAAAAELPEVQASAGPARALAAFRRDQGLGTAPVGYEFWGDVAGDEREERVLVIGGTLVVVGEGYRDGRGYDFERLGVRSPDDVQRARLEDITGDGKAEIILRVRERDRAGIRANWVVLGTQGAGIEELLSVPVFERTRQGIARARVQLRRQRRGAALIDIRSDGVEGLEPATYRGPMDDAAGGALTIMLPWGPVRQRTYQWTGGMFSEVAHEPNPDVYVRPDPTATVTVAERPVEPPPEPRSLSDDEVLARVRGDRGVAPSVPARFRTQADVAEGREPEQVLALGGAIVLYGPGLQGGRGYFYFEATEDGADLLSVETADLTADGKHEVIFTIRQNLGEFQRDILTVLHFGASSVQPILRVEIARYHGDAERIVNRVQLRRRGRSATLSIAPGEARGWDATTWPFSGFADDGVAPLLLPWQDDTRRYRFAGGTLVSP